MSQYESYRANAEAQRIAAAKTSLINRREMHLRSADTWDAMAAAVRDTVERSQVNEAAKAVTKARA